MCLFNVCIFQVFLSVFTPSALRMGYKAVTHIKTQNAFGARPNSRLKRASDMSTDSSPLTFNRMVCENRITAQLIVVLLTCCCYQFGRITTASTCISWCLASLLLHYMVNAKQIVFSDVRPHLLAEDFEFVAHNKVGFSLLGNISLFHCFWNFSSSYSIITSD